jgi:hypothetical protein
MTWDNVAFSGVAGGVIGSFGAFGAAVFVLKRQAVADRARETRTAKREAALGVLQGLAAMLGIVITSRIGAPREELIRTLAQFNKEWSMVVSLAFTVSSELGEVVHNVTPIGKEGQTQRLVAHATEEELQQALIYIAEHIGDAVAEATSALKELQ